MAPVGVDLFEMIRFSLNIYAVLYVQLYYVYLMQTQSFSSVIVPVPTF